VAFRRLVDLVAGEIGADCYGVAPGDRAALSELLGALNAYRRSAPMEFLAKLEATFCGAATSAGGIGLGLI
jgi:hypothetical protein